MIRVSEQDYKAGLEMAQLVSRCPDFLECLWARKRSCKKNCIYVDFREAFERQSPAFFGLCKRLSGYNSVIPDLRLIEIEGSPEQKHEVRERFHDLQTFSQLWFLALYPFFLANNEQVPFVKTEEIKRVEQNYLNVNNYRDVEKREEELMDINEDWFSRLAAIAGNFHNEEIGGKKLYLVIKVFLAGMEKFGPPANFESEGDKEEFFGEITAFLVNQKK